MRLSILCIQRGAFAAGGALAAGFVGIKADAVAQSRDHIGVLVHDDHAGGAQAQAPPLKCTIVEIERGVELIGPRTPMEMPP